MSDPQFNPEVQERLNGPLTGEFRERILAVKAKHSLGYWTVAEWAGFSGSFLGNVTRYPDNNISTEAATRLAEVIEKLEAAASGSNVAAMFSDEGTLRPSASEPTSPKRSAPAPTPEIDTIEHALSTLRKHGLGVILVAGTSVVVPVTTVSA